MPSTELSKSIDPLVDEYFDELTRVRQHLHANPELSWQEANTTSYLREILESHQILSVPGPQDRGLIVDLQLGNADSPVLAIRGDIDAIPVKEETGLPFASQNEGVMHACGHDVHSTILLGSLLVLNRLYRDQQLAKGLRVRGLFQPAEEIAQGASAMIEAGCLDEVQAIFAYHVDPSREVGRVGIKDGVQTGFCDEIQISVRGKGGHSARPHETNDTIYSAVQLVDALYGQLPRNLDSRLPVVLSICQFHGGTTANILPNTVELVGTLRALDIAARAKAQETIERIVASMASLTKTEMDLKLIDKVPGVVNDPRLMKLFENAATEVLGADQVDRIPASIGGEDFSFYTAHVPGAFTRLGCGSEKAGYWDLHSSHFDVDPETIRVGVRVMVRAALAWNNAQG